MCQSGCLERGIFSLLSTARLNNWRLRKRAVHENLFQINIIVDLTVVWPFKEFVIKNAVLAAENMGYFIPLCYQNLITDTKAVNPPAPNTQN